MRLCDYPRPRDTEAVLEWDRDGWDMNRNRKEFLRSVASTIARLGLPEEYDDMRRRATYGRQPEPDARLLSVLLGNLRLHGYIVRGSDGVWDQVPLTARQLHCVRLMAQGHTYGRIGSELGISVKTAGDIVRTATREIGAQHPHHLVAVAYQWSWLPTLAESRKIKITLGPDGIAPGFRLHTNAGTT